MIVVCCGGFTIDLHNKSDVLDCLVSYTLVSLAGIILVFQMNFLSLPEILLHHTASFCWPYDGVLQSFIEWAHMFFARITFRDLIRYWVPGTRFNSCVCLVHTIDLLKNIIHHLYMIWYVSECLFNDVLFIKLVMINTISPVFAMLIYFAQVSACVS